MVIENFISYFQNDEIETFSIYSVKFAKLKEFFEFVFDRVCSKKGKRNLEEEERKKKCSEMKNDHCSTQI